MSVQALAGDRILSNLRSLRSFSNSLKKTKRKVVLSANTPAIKAPSHPSNANTSFMVGAFSGLFHEAIAICFLG